MKKLLLSNEQLVNKAQNTNTNAIGTFDIIYKRYVDKVYQKCFYMTKDAEVAKDFTQEIFIKVFTKLDTFQNRSTFSTWLYSISHYYCLDQLRAGKCLNTESLSDAVIRGMCEADQSVSVDNQMHELELAMSDLPAEEVAMLRLKYEQGVSIKDISEQYCISESAVKMRLKRTRNKLQRVYANRGL